VVRNGRVFADIVFVPLTPVIGIGAVVAFVICDAGPTTIIGEGEIWVFKDSEWVF
jgi:hypothetical protein